jgi:flavin reductase (DIM6/NTAB) family NADH-FMN oxidoreductase RutF
MNDALPPQDMLPGPATLRDFRHALGRFATGVTLITTQTEGGPVGFTANSFASVSLDPPLVLWSAARASARFPIFAAAKTYSIHILGEDDAALVARFIRGGAGFDGLSTTKSAGGSPIIPQTLARFDCHQHATHDGGDHLIIVGRVTHFAMRDGAPLVFSQGTYGSFMPQP